MGSPSRGGRSPSKAARESLRRAARSPSHLRRGRVARREQHRRQQLGRCGSRRRPRASSGRLPAPYGASLRRRVRSPLPGRLEAPRRARIRRVRRRPRLSRGLRGPLRGSDRAPVAGRADAAPTHPAQNPRTLRGGSRPRDRPTRLPRPRQSFLSSHLRLPEIGRHAVLQRWYGEQAK